MEEITEDFLIVQQDNRDPQQTTCPQIQQLQFPIQENNSAQQQNFSQQQNQQLDSEAQHQEFDNQIDQHITEPEVQAEDQVQNIPMFMQQILQNREEQAQKIEAASQLIEFIISRAIKLCTISKKFEKTKIENIFKNLLDDPNQSVQNDKASNKLYDKINLEPDTEPKSNILLQGCSAQMKLKLMRGETKQFVSTGFETSKEVPFAKIKSSIGGSFKKAVQTSKAINPLGPIGIENKTQTQRQWKQNKKKIKKAPIQSRQKIENTRFSTKIVSILNEVKLSDDEQIGALRAIKQEEVNRKKAFIKSVLPSIHTKSKQMESKWRQQHSSSVNYSSSMALDANIKGKKGTKVSEFGDQPLISIKQNKPSLNTFSTDHPIQQSEKESSFLKEKGKLRKKDLNKNINRNKSLQPKTDYEIVQIIENKKSFLKQQIKGKQNLRGGLPSLESKGQDYRNSVNNTKKLSDWRKVKNESKQFQQKLNSFIKSRQVVGSIHLVESDHNRIQSEKRTQYKQLIENK